MWPSDEDYRKGKEFEKNHPHIMGWFHYLGSGVLAFLTWILLIFRDISNFLVRLKLLKPRNNKGMDRSLSVHWDERTSTGTVVSNFGSGHFHWDELGFDRPVQKKEALAVKILERLQNLRTFRGPGNIKEMDEIYKKPTHFFVFIGDEGKIQFQRFKSGAEELDGMITVPLEKEELRECMEALDKILQEPPDPIFFKATRYIDKDGKEVDRATFQRLTESGSVDPRL